MTGGASRRIARADLPSVPSAPFGSDEAALEAEIEALSARVRSEAEPEHERMLLHLRNRLAILRLESSPPDQGQPAPAYDELPSGPLVEVDPTRLTPGLLRAGILRHGCVLVRGLLDAGRAEQLAQEIELCFQERRRHDAGRSFLERYYAPFEHDPRRGIGLLRDWVAMAGGVFAVDSPAISFQMTEAIREAGLPELLSGYLGQAPLQAADKTTLRRAEPSVGGAWHQDGKFMGPVRALNLWLALSHCGSDAPGLDLVPRRLDEHVPTQTDGVRMLNQVSQQAAELAAGELPILRPVFEPGDALLFDELFLHKTASDASMRRPRYAIESWFFAPSGFPPDYIPLTI